MPMTTRRFLFLQIMTFEEILKKDILQYHSRVSIGGVIDLWVGPYSHENRFDDLEEAERAVRIIAVSPEILEALDLLLNSVIEYVNYRHDGDPYTEDARTMGEMGLNDLHRDGSLDKMKLLIKKAKGE